MKKHHLALSAALVLAFAMSCLSAPPLKRIQTIELPPDVTGNFDQFAVDLKGDRLFATPEDHKTIEIVSLKTNKRLGSINIPGRPHSLLYRADLNRLYQSDDDGSLRIIDAESRKILKTLKLLLDADSMAYDPSTKYLYVVNGGGDEKASYSMISIIDTTAGNKIGDIKVEGDTLESMALDPHSPRIYVNNRDKNAVTVVDREKRAAIANWPVTKGKTNAPIALDAAGHRLFSGCRSGVIVVFDTESGKELQALPITKGANHMDFDPASHRIYVSGDGAADVYEQTDPDHYQSLGKVTTAPLARTACLVPELHRYYVASPKHGNQNAAILVYEVE